MRLSPPLRLTSRALARLQDESGIALVLALVVLLVLVIAAGTAAQLVTSNETNSGRERQVALRSTAASPASTRPRTGWSRTTPAM